MELSSKPSRNKPPHPIATLWLVLTAIKDMIDDDSLSNEPAMTKLREMLGSAVFHPYLAAAIGRLEAIDPHDEMEFELAVREESLAAMEEDSRRRRGDEEN